MHLVMAQLCGFLAQTTSDLGNPRISVRWWRTAQWLADLLDNPFHSGQRFGERLDNYLLSPGFDLVTA